MPRINGTSSYLVNNRQLSLDDSAGRACVSAGAAACASIFVNFVDVAFGNCSNGAFANAGAASNANVSDFVSHFSKSFLVNNVLQKYNKKYNRSVDFSNKFISLLLIVYLSVINAGSRGRFSSFSLAISSRIVCHIQPLLLAF